MPLNLSAPETTELKPRILVCGVGGAGGNAVNNMIDAQLEGVDFVVANTDAQALQRARTDRRIQMGAAITEGLGAGARPEVGEQAAEDSWPRSRNIFRARTWCSSPPAWAAAPAPAQRL
jgi:cell division protein FtsZ